MRSPSAILNQTAKEIYEKNGNNVFEELEQQKIAAQENAAKIAQMSIAEKNELATQQYIPTAQVAHAEQREDTAIQRQMQDLQNAGINPILMATNGWGGASSGAAVSYIDKESEKVNAAANKEMANSAKINAVMQGISSIINATANAAGTAMGFGYKKTSNFGFGR